MNACSAERLFDTYLAWISFCTGSGLIVGAYDGIQNMRECPKTANKFRESTITPLGGAAAGFLFGMFTPPLVIGAMASGAVKMTLNTKDFFTKKAIKS